MKTKQIILLLAVTALALSVRAAEPRATVADAVKALKDKANYSWSTTSEMANSQFPAMTTTSKTEKDGFTLITSEGPNGEIQAVKKGTNGVVKTEDGWQSAAELQTGSQGGPGRGFSGRLLTMLAPAEDAEDLLKGVKELKAGDGGLFSGDLTEQAAKDRASFFGHRRGRQGGNGFTLPETEGRQRLGQVLGQERIIDQIGIENFRENYLRRGRTRHEPHRDHQHQRNWLDQG